jgi:hypothetical protein
MELSKSQKERYKWVEDYNNSLPQIVWYSKEFKKNISNAVGGIYDSERMNFIFSNLKSNRIKEIIKQQKFCCVCESMIKHNEVDGCVRQDITIDDQGGYDGETYIVCNDCNSGDDIKN